MSLHSLYHHTGHHALRSRALVCRAMAKHVLIRFGYFSAHIACGLVYEIEFI